MPQKSLQKTSKITIIFRPPFLVVFFFLGPFSIEVLRKRVFKKGLCSWLIMREPMILTLLQ